MLRRDLFGPQESITSHRERRCFVTWVTGGPCVVTAQTWSALQSFLGTGFAFFDAETGEYRLYLMMDNGALNESIGHRQVDSSLVFTTRTHGPVPFPDLRTEIRVTDAGLEVDYISRSEGETVRDQNLLVRVDDEE